MQKYFALGLVLVICTAHASELKIPYVIENACPFEGCSFGFWDVNRDTDVYESSSESSRVVARLAAGKKVQVETGVMFVVPGTAKVVSQPHKSAIKIDKNEIIQILDYIGEGYSRIYQGGEFFEVKIARTKDKCKDNSNWRYCWVNVIEEPVVNWWVRVKLNKDNESGWILMNENKLSPIDRLSEYLSYNQSFELTPYHLVLFVQDRTKRTKW